MGTVRRMLDHVREAAEIARGRRREHLDTDRLLNPGLVRLFHTVGEAATRVPEEFRAQRPAVAWRDTSDMRNRLVHACDTIKFDIVRSVIQDGLPQLIEQWESILREDPEDAPRAGKSPRTTDATTNHP
ncbi:DUF86 domain-containing protein [Candidatus Poribacteria bacterium]|nr:DUF86 domain-containing protein [Candidatus Poribacteria bacterium]MBT5532035.1 DUF86 domain-containing protein [Candidatus Poribacteria bacterium]MBT5714109.1 DUF86 domain-containing protein [Candidatus Poribacteria bacterium]MBT7096362.1 DUF86 domain-containing protein [Candidatus Poribacteria bacterium]MBT7804816.1 DUF86 domain-containing protein [Candidatus Poribacteria bacterium]